MTAPLASVTLGGRIPEGGSVPTRVLLAYEDEYRAYREILAAGVGLLRPRTEVCTATPAGLAAELERFEPHVVVCGAPDSPDPGHVPAWVALPPEVGRPARVRVGDSMWGAVGLTLQGLLAIVDETEALVGAEEGRGCDRGSPGPIQRTSL